MTRPGIEPRSPGPLANTLTAGPIYLYRRGKYENGSKEKKGRQKERFTKMTERKIEKNEKEKKND